MPWSGDLCWAPPPRRNPRGPQTNVPLVDMLGLPHCWGRLWCQPYPEGLVLLFLHLGPSQPPAGVGSREGPVQKCGWGGVEADCGVGVSSVLPLPCPALPIIRADRTCGERGQVLPIG